MLNRRGLLRLLVALPLASRASGQAGPPLADLSSRLRELEKDSGGRLGVAVLDTGTGQKLSYRADERFPMCSTFKVLLAGAILQRAERQEEQLQRPLRIPAPPLLYNSPLTQAHAGGMLTIAQLCEAVVTVSDNTAANMLLATIGGPAGVTRFARALKDPVTRLDRTEMALNESRAGDLRDTTSPAAMVQNLRLLLLGEALQEASRTQLRQWMEASRTGLKSLRAQLPPLWRAADKTGKNGEHTSNDIAVLWPPSTPGKPVRPPLIVAAYLTQSAGPEERREALLAEIGRLVAAA